MTLPTRNELYQANIARLEAQYSITIPAIERNFLVVWAAVNAGTSWLLYKALAKVQKNAFPDTADPESKGGTLERFGRVVLGRNPNPATAAFYEIQITADPSAIGNVIPAFTQWKSNDESLNPNKLYQLDTAHTILTTSDTITVRAIETGLDSQLTPGNVVRLTGPIPLVERNSSVTTETVTPLAAEDIELYRQLILDNYRLEPQGGSGSDYRLWANDTQGVAQSYPYSNTTDSDTVDLYIEATIADSTDGKGTPTTAILAAVEVSVEDPTIDRPGRKPTTDKVNYQPITPRDIDIVVTGYQNLTPVIEQNIFDTIKNYLDDVRPFIGSIDVPALQNDFFDTNRIVLLIMESNPQSVFTSVELQVDGFSQNSITFDFGNIPFLNSVSYV